MLWLFDMGKNYRHLFEPSIITKLEDANAMDKKRRTQRGKPSKKKDNLRSACQDWLRNIRPSDPTSLPINLEILDFTIFTRYLYTFKKKVKKRDSEGNVSVDDGEKTIWLSPSSFDGACSALSHLFTESGISKEKTDITKELWTKLSSFKKGTRRVLAKEKKKLGLSTIEGKKPLPFCAYEYLAKILFESDKAEYVAAHTFLILEWNLISRAEYLVDATIDAVTFKGDAMLFDIGKTKTDQVGT